MTAILGCQNELHEQSRAIALADIDTLQAAPAAWLRPKRRDRAKRVATIGDLAATRAKLRADLDRLGGQADTEAEADRIWDQLAQIGEKMLKLPTTSPSEVAAKLLLALDFLDEASFPLSLRLIRDAAAELDAATLSVARRA